MKPVSIFITVAQRDKRKPFVWFLTCLNLQKPMTDFPYPLNVGIQEIFLSQNCQDRLCGPPSFLFVGYQHSFPGAKWPGCEVDHHLRVVPRLGTRGGVLQLPIYALMAQTRMPFTLCWHVA
jgi:hypothetical protein